MVLFGLILLGVAIACFLGYRNAKAKLGEILLTQTSSIQEVSERAEAVAEALGSGYSSDYTEIKGKMESPELLSSALARRDCVYYRASVTREWEEEEWYKDDEGKQQKRIHKGSDTLFSETRHVPFYVNDGTGRLKVDPSDADIELESALSRFEPEHGLRFSGSQLRLGDITVHMSSGLPALSRGRRTLGYRFEEAIFPPTGTLYLLGTVQDHGGTLTLVKPKEKGQRYIISHKSEEELVSQQDQHSKLFFWGSVAAAVSGLLLTLAGLVTGNTGF